MSQTAITRTGSAACAASQVGSTPCSRRMASSSVPVGRTGLLALCCPRGRRGPDDSPVGCHHQRLRRGSSASDALRTAIRHGARRMFVPSAMGGRSLKMRMLRYLSITAWMRCALVSTTLMPRRVSLSRLPLMSTPMQSCAPASTSSANIEPLLRPTSSTESPLTSPMSARCAGYSRCDRMNPRGLGLGRNPGRATARAGSHAPLTCWQAHGHPVVPHRDARATVLGFVSGSACARCSTVSHASQCLGSDPLMLK